jgi:glycosyltransferase involved in cell wall biosynthesis
VLRKLALGHLIYFSGRYQLNSLGAVKTIVQHITEGYPDNKHLYLIGMGNFEQIQARPNITYINISKAYQKQSFIYQVLLKLVKVVTPSVDFNARVFLWVNLKYDIIADKIATKEAQKLIDEVSDITIVMGISPMTLFLGQRAKRTGKKFIIHTGWAHPSLQNKLVTEAYIGLNLKVPPFSKKRICRQLKEIDTADLIICTSNFVRDSFLVNGIPGEKVINVGRGIELGRFQIPDNVRSCKDPFVILFIGRVCIEKGIHILMQALEYSDIQEVSVILNGSIDPQSKPIVDKASKMLEKKGIRIIVDPGDPRRHLKNASILVQPSVHDAFGFTVLEAMASGVPVIVSSNVGAKDCVLENKNGFIFQSGNYEELAKYITFFFDNPISRIEYGVESSEIAKKYDILAASERQLSVLQTMLEVN